MNATYDTGLFSTKAIMDIRSSAPAILGAVLLGAMALAPPAQAGVIFTDDFSASVADWALNIGNGAVQNQDGQFTGTPGNVGWVGINNGGKLSRQVPSVTISNSTVFTNLAIVGSSSLDYGNVAINTTNTLSVTVTNAGTATRNITNFTFTGDGMFALASGVTTGPVDAGGSTNIPVEYTPTSLATHNGTLILGSDDPGNATTNISLTGSGITAVEAGIVVRYSFESNLNDTALGGVASDTLTVVGTASYVEGVGGYAAAFYPDYFYAADSADNDLAGDTWTIEAFIKRNGAFATWDRLIVKWDNPYSYHCSLRNGHLDLFAPTAASNPIQQKNTTPATDFGDGDWHHVAVSSDGSTTEAWIDGTNVYSGAAITLLDVNSTMGLGDAPGAPAAGNRFTGWMDEVLLHNVGVDQAYINTRVLLLEPPPPPPHGTLFIIR